jgi:hypothetical protein
MRTRSLFFVLVVIAIFAALSAGCRRRGAVRGVVTAGGDQQSRGGAVQVGGGTEVARGTPREQLDQLDRVLRTRGYVPVGPATHATIAQNGITAYPIDVRRGHCYSIALFGQPGTDVNLVMLDPAGRDIGHDVRNDEHPWVSFCAARGGRFVARVQMARGQGDIFFAPYFMPGRTPGRPHRVLRRRAERAPGRADRRRYLAAPPGARSADERAAVHPRRPAERSGAA